MTKGVARGRDNYAKMSLFLHISDTLTPHSFFLIVLVKNKLMAQMEFL